MMKRTYLSPILDPIRRRCCILDPLFPEWNHIYRPIPLPGVYCNEYVYLMPVMPSHYSAFQDLYENETHMQYVGSGTTLPLAQVESMVRAQAHDNLLPCPSRYSWSIITHEGIVGRIFLVTSNRELIYRLRPAFCGRGIATLAGKLVISQFKGPFTATVHPRNRASIGVLLKLGFKLDQTGVPKFGSIRDAYVRPF